MLFARKTGWIGVDVGTSAVKVAQLVRHGRRWRLAAASVVPRRTAWPAAVAPDDEARSSLDEFQAAQSLEPNYQGRRVAASLPMAVCDVHALDRLLEGEPRARDLIRKTIETTTGQSAQPFELDYWTSSRGDKGSQRGWTNVLTVVRNWSDQLCDDVARVGWSCEMIDGLPFAMARAVGMVSHDSSGAPIAALDWGSAHATLCVVVDGQPTYVRCLKDCPWHRVLTALADSLELSQPEAEALVTEHGLPDPAAESPSESSGLIQEIIADPLDGLVGELRRTLEHFQYQRRTAGPKQLYLMGGGATLNRLDAQLAARLGIEVRVWQLRAETSGTASDMADSSCLFAPAAALSALAWHAPQPAKSNEPPKANS